MLMISIGVGSYLRRDAESAPAAETVNVVEVRATDPDRLLQLAGADRPGTFPAVFFTDLYDDMASTFGRTFEQDLIGRDLEITGTLCLFKDRPRIMVRRIDQLKLREEAR